jgi:hypothetical protein
VIAGLRLVGIAFGSFIIAWLAMSIVGSFIPHLLGAWTVPVATVLLGGFVFRDIAGRERRRKQT